MYKISVGKEVIFTMDRQQEQQEEIIASNDKNKGYRVTGGKMMKKQEQLCIFCSGSRD